MASSQGIESSMASILRRKSEPKALFLPHSRRPRRPIAGSNGTIDDNGDHRKTRTEKGSKGLTTGYTNQDHLNQHWH